MSANLGRRLKELRKRRGLTQRELARVSGVSLSLIRKLEQGERDDTRLETARRLAVALRVPTTVLVAEPSEDRANPAAGRRWAAVREALSDSAIVHGPAEPPTLTGVSESLRAALPLFSSNRMSELENVLPLLIRDARTLDGPDPESRDLRQRIMRLTGWLLTQTREFEAAETALAHSLRYADDRLEAAATVSTRCWLLLRRGRLGETRALAAEWADRIEPRLSRATPTELSAWGWLLLRLSAAAVRDNRPDEAEEALRLAQAAAVTIGREFAPAEFLRAFGPVTVAFKRAENAMIVDRPDLVLKLATRIPTGRLRPTSSNRNRHLLDVAEAHVRTRQYTEAVHVLQGVRADAPEWFPNQRYARDIVGRVIDRRRTLTPQIRELATAVGLPM